ncbi:MAG: hypothetical protein QOJ42_1001 [Acidobacteriaceae bacterium]|jgi:hypothetical protein|nr:hypothetical protein [Acidobacteriaceae bacterium]MDT7811085.1 hypothetical protein [Acidobacteriaceae bacterium]
MRYQAALRPDIVADCINLHTGLEERAAAGLQPIPIHEGIDFGCYMRVVKSTFSSHATKRTGTARMAQTTRPTPARKSQSRQ